MVLDGLTRKRNEIESAIAAYEKKIEQAKRDLSHVNASLRLFTLEGDTEQFPVYMELNRLFKRGEIVKLCKQALVSGPLDTRELALAVIRMKELDEGDAVLRKSIAFRIVQAMGMQAKRKLVDSSEKRNGVRVWRLFQSTEILVKRNSC